MACCRSDPCGRGDPERDGLMLAEGCLCRVRVEFERTRVVPRSLIPRGSRRYRGSPGEMDRSDGSRSVPSGPLAVFPGRRLAGKFIHSAGSGFIPRFSAEHRSSRAAIGLALPEPRQPNPPRRAPTAMTPAWQARETSVSCCRMDDAVAKEWLAVSRGSTSPPWIS